mmetsp:Transcript_36776/g.114312  ORF Transcript_36776/g.114312 Transcript_36776/m.114312 type:complete len:274 (-) Transcript_36776:177-998(-)
MAAKSSRGAGLKSRQARIPQGNRSLANAAPCLKLDQSKMCSGQGAGHVLKACWTCPAPKDHAALCRSKCSAATRLDWRERVRGRLPFPALALGQAKPVARPENGLCPSRSRRVALTPSRRRAWPRACPNGPRAPPPPPLPATAAPQPPGARRPPGRCIHGPPALLAGALLSRGSRLGGHCKSLPLPCRLPGPPRLAPPAAVASGHGPPSSSGGPRGAWPDGAPGRLQGARPASSRSARSCQRRHAASGAPCPSGASPPPPAARFLVAAPHDPP